MSAVGAFAAVVTIFLFLTTAYMIWRVYVKQKYRMLSKEEKQLEERMA